MVKEFKVEEVQDIKAKFDGARAAVLADYRGLNVAEVTQLRTLLRKAGIEYKVLKNTLTWLAVKELGLTELEQYLAGPTAIAFDRNDPVAPAKILAEFAKTHKKLELKAGVIEGKVVDAAGVEAVASLPSRDVLLAKMLGSMNAPVSGLVNVLSGLPRNLVYVLEAVRKQKEEAA